MYVAQSRPRTIMLNLYSKIFYRTFMNAARDIDIGNSVRLSVCPLHAGIVWKQLNVLQDSFIMLGSGQGHVHLIWASNTEEVWIWRGFLSVSCCISETACMGYRYSYNGRLFLNRMSSIEPHGHRWPWMTSQGYISY